jgi:hypothetical protein
MTSFVSSYPAAQEQTRSSISARHESKHRSPEANKLAKFIKPSSTKNVVEIERMKALEEYRSSPETTTKIAARYGFSASTLTVIVRKAGIPLRSRGRKKATQPSAVQKKILQMTRHATYEATGKKFNRSKQRISKIVHRWPAWLDENYPTISAVTVTSPAQPPQPVKPRIITFRLTTAEWSDLRATAKPLSVNQHAREIVLAAMKRPELNCMNQVQ